MVEDELNIEEKKANLIFFVLSLLAIALAFYIGYTHNSDKAKLLDDYIGGFKYCENYCKGQSKVGYVRAVSDLHHKCFCYNESSNKFDPKS